MKRIREVISKYRTFCMKIVIIVAFVIFPFVLEKILISTPIVSQFSNETWFSFMASYSGAIVTVIVMLITFKKSDKENKEIIKRQMKQHQIDMENKRLTHLLGVLFADYYFYDCKSICEDVYRFIKDFKRIEGDMFYLDYLHKLNYKLYKLILNLQQEDRGYIKRFEEILDIKKDKDEQINELLDVVLELKQNINLKRDDMIAEYQKYEDAISNIYYE